MKKSIVVCEALGHYWSGVRYFLESLGYNVIPLDQAESKERDSGYLNFESVADLDPELYQVLVTGDNSLVNCINLNIENSIHTDINDLKTFMNKVECRKNLPAETDVIKYPEIKVIPFDGKCIIKPIVGKGSLPGTNRNCYTVTEPQYSVEWIEHSQAQVCLARFELGELKEIVFYTGKPEEPWSKAKPGDFVLDDVLSADTIETEVTNFMKHLGKVYEIDGIIDAEFMLNDHKLWYAESNPRLNGQSYFVAQKMLCNFLRQKLPDYFITDELKRAYTM